MEVAGLMAVSGVKLMVWCLAVVGAKVDWLHVYWSFLEV